MSSRVKSRNDRLMHSADSRDIAKYRKAVGIAAALAVFATTSCSGQSDAPSVRTEHSKSYTVESGDVELHVVSQGGSEPDEVVIAIHGGPGLSLESLEDLTALAGDDRQLIRYDQRGSGQSTAPADNDFSLQRQIEDIEAIRQSTGAETIDVIGRSWGGLLATAYAAEHPEKVDDVVLISAIPLDVNEFLAGQDRFSERIAKLQQADIIPSPLPEILDNSCADRIDAVLPVYMADPTGSAPEISGSCTADTSQMTYEALIQPGVVRPYAEKASLYEGDVLILAGEKDPFGPQWPQRISEILGQASAKQVIFENTGHFVTYERPEESLRLIDDFIG